MPTQEKRKRNEISGESNFVICLTLEDIIVAFIIALLWFVIVTGIAIMVFDAGWSFISGAITGILIGLLIILAYFGRKNGTGDLS